MVIPGLSYRIVAKHSQKVLDVWGRASRDGADVQQYQDFNNLNQRWKFIPVEPEVYKIVSVQSGKVLDVRGGPGATSDGIQIQQYEWLANENQKFRIEQVEPTHVKIVSKHSGGKVLDVRGGPGATGDGVKVQQYTWLANENQKWRLDPLREWAVDLLDPPVLQRILDVARGLFEGEMERQLRAKANNGLFGKISKIERLKGEWLSDGIIELLAYGLAKPAGAADIEPWEQKLREELAPNNRVPLNWLGFNLEWFVKDLISVGQDDCDVSARVFITWKVENGNLVFSTAPIDGEDVDLDCGASAAGLLVALIDIFNLSSLVLRSEEEVLSIPVQVKKRLEIVRSEVQKEIGPAAANIGVKELFIAGAPPRFGVVLQW
jgi:hypothetical protein